MEQPTIRVFGLVIGIDKYKSGAVWNLESCVDDAQKVQRWLRKDLKVPKDQICVLLDNHATKHNIEQSFLRHLVHNENIQRGDAIVIFFAGHGSTAAAPTGWFHKTSVGGVAEVLCSYDFGHRGVAGISDRSLQAMLQELSDAKGDNIAVILDSCFAPLQSPSNIRDRRRTRWTPSEKVVTSHDLLDGLWPAARKQTSPRGGGFCNMINPPYTLLAACSTGEKAIEGKDGGKFTLAFLETARETPLHSASYVSLLQHIRPKIGESQKPVFVGLNTMRPVFDAVPFSPDQAYYQAETIHDSKTLRIGLGAVHGVVAGTEFSLHEHNYRGSRNPSIAHVSVTDVYPTWSFGYASHPVPTACWAQIKRWNNGGGFKIRSKRSLSMVRQSSGASFRSVKRSLFHRPTW
ncbi:hypothetical protein R3P38DRAFT_3179027 [Favolaschia claudopus]|uniref:Caspase domain-containing protein n=1 Tax=Favolaschia claudopus TaxID=2862362 RepID=A0AAW0CU87_9AGAR